MAADLAGIFPLRLTAAQLERLPDELDGLERGVLFVAWPRPPRVGSFVRVELSLGEDAPRQLEAHVIWSRPARPGVLAGFRAELSHPPDALVEQLRGLADIVRRRVLARELEAPRKQPAAPLGPIDAPIRERIRIREPVAEAKPQRPPLHIPMIPSRLAEAPALEQPSPQLDAPQPAADDELELDFGDRSDSFELDLGPTDALLAARNEAPIPAPAPPLPTPAPVARMRMATAVVPPPAVDELLSFADLNEAIADAAPAPAADDSISFADLNDPIADAPPAPSIELDLPPLPELPVFPPAPPPVAAPRQVTPPPTISPDGVHLVRLPIASLRTFQLHYDRFFSQGEVYLTTNPTPPQGTRVRVIVDVPDGEPPLVLHAVVAREVAPPAVPKAGWVAKINDPDGSAGERLATAAVMADAV